MPFRWKLLRPQQLPSGLHPAYESSKRRDQEERAEKHCLDCGLPESIHLRSNCGLHCSIWVKSSERFVEWMGWWCCELGPFGVVE